MSVSITQIAKELNIAPSTVSRALNGKGAMSEELRRKIAETAKQMGYIPNTIARNLQQKSAHVIGIIIPDITESFFARIIKGIDKVVSAAGYGVFLCNSDENPEKEEQYLKLLYENRVAGMIAATVRHALTDDDLLISGTIPSVLIDNLPHTNIPYHSVTTNDFAAGELAADYLARQGHTRIGGIMGRQEESTGQLRFEGFLHGLAAHGISFDKRLIRFCDFKEPSAYEAMTSLLHAKDCTAVFAASSKMTYGALGALRAAGRIIPHDISLLGFDVEDRYNLFVPGITTVMQQEEEIGHRAASLLLQQINAATSPEKQYLTPILRERASVRKVD